MKWLARIVSVELRAERKRLDAIVREISSRFWSGNCVPVERCILKADEWKAILKAHYDR